MPFYRLLLLLVLKMPGFPAASCGQGCVERQPRPGPFPPRPPRSGGDAFCDGPMAVRRAGGERHHFPSPSRLTPPSPTGAARRGPGGCPSGPAEEEGLGGRTGSPLGVPGPLLGPQGAPAAPFPPSRLSPGRRFQASTAGWVCCVWFSSGSVDLICARSHVLGGKRVIVTSPAARRGQCERAGRATAS